ncbi:hypothetical protein ACRYCC_06235 [Actinomadura scrupuli]|uniref:hypothetical protein n=1 Tax=Actinomadura scrupuli TaxID=559629 RepID=UPI003D95A60E
MSGSILTKVRGRYAVLVVAVAALAGLGLSAIPATAAPPDVIVADTFAWRTARYGNAASYQFALPAGRWTVVASATAQNNNASTESVACALYVTGDNVSRETPAGRTTIGPKPQFANMSTTTAGIVTTTGTVTWACFGYTTTYSMSVFNVSIVATRVNTLTRVNLG